MTFIVPERKRRVQVGDRFERLTVSGVPFYYRSERRTNQLAVCDCACGTSIAVMANCLVSGATRSCGCLQIETAIKENTTHGGRKTRLYGIWKGMRDRCSRSRHRFFSNYGGRGISVCDEWESFESFRRWAMASGYRDELTIDRIDNDGNYEPINCRWVTFVVQANNRRSTVFVTAFGASKTSAEWEKDARCLVSAKVLRQRIRRGWNHESALITDV